MKVFLFFMMMVCKVASAAQGVFSFTPTQVEAFSAEIDAQNPMQVLLKNNINQQTEVLSMKYSLIDIKKFYIHVSDPKKSQISLEALLVVTSVANAEQNVRVYIPVEPKLIQIKSKELKPVCSLKNQGDFSWESESELQERLRLVKNQKDSQIQIKMGRHKQGKTLFEWQTCFSMDLTNL